MKYALNLADDGRILSVTFEKYASANSVLVDELPDGNVTDYRHAGGELAYDPVPADPKEEAKARIAERKRNLADTDYNILKIVEGAATLAEMTSVIAQRAQWRKEINELEQQYGI